MSTSGQLPKIITDSFDLLLQFEYRLNGIDLIGNIRFFSVNAFRFRDEYRSSGFYTESYDTLCEVIDSKWMAELKHFEPEGINDLEDKHHFAVFLSSNGYLEVIALSFNVGQPHEGLLSNGYVDKP